jgi:hypothetical protein
MLVEEKQCEKGIPLLPYTGTWIVKQALNQQSKKLCTGWGQRK